MRQHKYYKLIKVDYEDTGYFYIKNVSNEVGEFSISNYTSGTLEYSTDGVNWTSYDLINKPSVNVNPDSHIYLRGTSFKKISGYGAIVFTKDFHIGGNFMSLSNYSTMSNITTIDGNNKITNCFYENTHLINAEKLNFGNVTTIAAEGLFGLFFGCSNLIKIPDFSSITSLGVSSLGSCFQNCSSLTTGADLSSVTSCGTQALSYAYFGCKKLSNVVAPNIQNLTTDILQDWLGNSAGSQATGTKTVNVPTGATITTGSNSGIPTGWTRVDY